MGKVPDGQYLKGVLDTSTKLGELMSKVTDGTPEAVRDVCLDIQARAQKLTPVKTGTLQGSAFTTVSGSGDGTVEGRVKFPEKYAAKQHEDVSLHHEQGHAKFLETAMLEKQDQLREQLAAILARAFGG